MPADSIPEGDELERIIGQLIASWTDDLGPFTFQRGRHPTGALMVYGLASHTHQLARAALVLDAEGCSMQVVPLARQAIECAMTAAWLSVFPEAIGAMIHEGARQKRQALEGFTSLGLPRAPEVTAEINALLDELASEGSASGRVFKERCADLEGGDRVYAVYRVASDLCHAGIGVAGRYAVQVDDPENTGGFVLMAEPPPEPGSWLGIMLSMLVIGGLAWDRLEKHHRHRKELGALARRLRINDRPTMTSQGFIRLQSMERRIRAERRAGPAARPDTGAQ